MFCSALVSIDFLAIRARRRTFFVHDRSECPDSASSLAAHISAKTSKK